jgi:ketosteroid isomerase-like protein
MIFSRSQQEVQNECGSPKAAVEDLIAKVVGGKALEAFDRYYADDVTMQENDQSPRIGKAACRAFEESFLSKIKAVRTYVCDGYVISGNKAFIVYRIDADHADWGTLNMSEVAIQEWSNGKVVREKFVY